MFWDQEALQQNPWSQPVSTDTIEYAKQGNWAIHLTQKAVPRDWLPQDINRSRILCLACAGGQQAPVLAAAGATVTVFDFSQKQLELDQWVAKRDGLTLHTIQGDMRDLSALEDQSFDCIINPISNLYIPELFSVWNECYRVLKHNGTLLASFYNPILFTFERNNELESQGLLKPQFTIPYSDTDALSEDQLQTKIKQGKPIVFGHSLSDQINGQLQAGFKLTGLYEDEHPNPRFLIERYIHTMLATRATKC